MAVSEDQKATRRRALGRKLATKAKQVADLSVGVTDSDDLQFLTPAERKILNQQFGYFNKLSGNLLKLGNKLEGK